MSSSSEAGIKSERGRKNRLATLLLCVAVGIAPLPYGATDPSAVCLLVALLGASLILAKFRRRGRRDWLIFGAIVFLGICYALVLHEQLSPAPWLGRPRDPVWDRMTSLVGSAPGAALSLVRDQPFIALGNTLACFGSLCCALIVSASKRNAEQLLKIVAWSTLAYGVYGIAAYLVRPEMVLWREKVLYRTVLSATFPNRNTAAVYFGMGAVVWALILLRDILHQRGFRHGQWRIVDLGSGARLGVDGLGFVVCFVAMMLTGSRAGAAVSVLGILMTAPLLLRRQLPSGRAGFWIIFVVILAVASGYLLLGGQVTERLGEHGLAGGGRWETYVSTINMIAAHPFLGSGLGTFPFVFPRYRSADVSIWGIWDRAHNTLLELAAEVGTPLAALIAMAWMMALLLMLSGSLRRRRGSIFPIAGFVCCSIALLHSMLDFSLQVPGFAVTTMALMGMGLAQSEREQIDSQSFQSFQASRSETEVSVPLREHRKPRETRPGRGKG